MTRSTLAALVLTLACAHAPPRPTPQGSAHVAAGAQALGRGDLERAEAEYHLALEYEPGTPEALNGLGLVARQRGDRGKARDLFRAAVRAREDFAEGHSNLGVLDLEEGRLEPALGHFHDALGIDPGYAAARRNLARTLDRLGRQDEALAEYLKLTSTIREDADAWAELAGVDLALGRKQEASEAAATALSLDARHPVARRIRANLLRDAGQVEEALGEYDAILRERPEDAMALVDRGIGLVLVGRAREAVPDLRRAEAIAPREPAAPFALGVALAESGDDAGAATSFAKAIALMEARGRDYPQARYLYAGALGRQGRTGEAIAAYQAFLSRARGDARLAELVRKAEVAALRTGGKRP